MEPSTRTYLDAAQTAPLHPAAREALLAALDEGWADPRRLHREGRRARLLLDGAREAMAAEIGCRTEEVTFTGSHTEAVHAGVLGAAAGRERAGRRVLTSAVEHSAVLHAADRAGERTGIDVDPLGRVNVESFTTELHSGGVSIACLQSANGEVGTRQPVEQVAEAARAARVPLVVDAAATLGHELPPSGWDVLVGDPRAWGAPPGLGLLAVRAGVRWRSPYPSDEGVEIVPGAPSVPVALAAAVALRAMNTIDHEGRRELTSRVRTAAARLTDTMVAGDPDGRLPHVVTFSCLYVDGEALVDGFDRAGFAVGSGSACTSSTLEPSHVLAAMGMLTHGNVRLGLPVGVTGDDVDRFCAVLPGVVADVQAFLGADGL